MKSVVLYSLLALLSCFPSCTPLRVQGSKSAQQRIKTHKLIAILPFEVSMEGGYRPNGVTYGVFQEKLRTKGQELQVIVYNHFQRHPGSVKVLSPTTTNRILSEAGIAPDMIVRLPKDELCRLLGVDAVVFGRTRTKQIRQNLSATSSAALLMFTGFIVVGNAKSTVTDFDIRIHDAGSPDHIWRCTAVVKTKELIQQFTSHKLAASLPYDRPRKRKLVLNN